MGDDQMGIRVHRGLHVVADMPAVPGAGCHGARIRIGQRDLSVRAVRQGRLHDPQAVDLLPDLVHQGGPDAFVALPGGFGTLDEMFEMLTWRQLGLGDRPCAFLDVEDFYDPLLAMMDRMVAEGFLHAAQREDLWHGDDIDALFAWMRAYVPVQADKWLRGKRRKALR